MVRNYSQYYSNTTNFWISPSVNLKDGIDFGMLFTLLESRRTSDPSLSRDCGGKLQLPQDSEALRLLQR